MNFSLVAGMTLASLAWLLSAHASTAMLEIDARRGCLELFLKIKRPHSSTLPQLAALRTEELAATFRDLEKKYPGRIAVSSYGNVEGHELIKVHVIGGKKAKKLLITAGVHGNEALGSLTAYNFIESVLTDPTTADSVDITLYPMINPRALAKGKRKLRIAEKIDFNRVFNRQTDIEEIQLLIKELEGQQFDGALDLHGAPFKNHFFIIGASPDLRIAKRASELFPSHLLLESRTGTYPGHQGVSSDPNRYTLYLKGISQSNLQGTVKEFLHREIKIPQVYVLEYPMLKSPDDAVLEFEQLMHAFLHSYKESPTQPN
jgi:hypothetical protein